MAMYAATEAGFEIRLFGFLLVYRLKKQDIVSARVINGFLGGLLASSNAI
jgi:hypothetical protein